jgi:putative endopeptidase
MHRLLPALACSAALVAGCAGLAGRPLHSGIDRHGGDPTVRPQDDLFRHVNGTWIKTVEMPADKSYIGSWVSIQDKVQEQLRGLLEAAAKRRDDADARRIADLYASFMDEAAVESAGLAPLAGELAAIDAVQSAAELARAM